MYLAFSLEQKLDRPRAHTIFIQHTSYNVLCGGSEELFFGGGGLCGSLKGERHVVAVKSKFPAYHDTF